mgnify:CR=1 FL=1
MNLVNMGNKILFLCVSLLAYVNSYAKVVLPAYFTDNMVLQQNTEVTFHGKAVLGKILKVTTGWNNEVYVTQVNKDGYLEFVCRLLLLQEGLYVDIYGW